MKIKKVMLSESAFFGVTVCGLRQPADRHETNLELGMYQFSWPDYFANFVLSYESTSSEDAVHDAVHDASLSLAQGQG